MKKFWFILSLVSCTGLFAQDHYSGINTSSRIGILNGSFNPAEFSNMVNATEVHVFSLSVMETNNKISFSDTTKRNFARLDKFYQQEKVNPSLKKFLDLYRVVYALKHKLAGDEKNFAYYYSAIAMENCPLKSRILLKLPTFILKKLFVFGRLLNSNKMYLNFYTRLFKS